MRRLTNESVCALSRMLIAREISSEELVRAFLERIAQKNGEIGAFITVCEQSAIKRAVEIDAMRARGEELGALAGIPFAVKDNICTRGVATTCGSRMLENFVPPYSATVIEKLESEGCILLGKLNMDEFAMGSATDTSIFGVCRNPLDTSRTAGGSSGGAAAAVAAGIVPFALGSDTGGSVRQPAAFCGVVGAKPTYGAVSRYGLVAFASSLDQIGPITADVRSNALVLDAIVGADKRDATSKERAYSLLDNVSTDICGLRIGFPRSELDGVSADVARAMLAAVDSLRTLGAQIVDITLPDTDALLAAYYIISSAEASSNLARFDGVRYGHRSERADTIDGLITKSRSEGFGDEVKRRIMLGTYALSRDARDTYYKRALLHRENLVLELEKTFAYCDAILMPTAPTVAHRLDRRAKAPLDIYIEDKLCVIANMAGVPAISLPYGKGEGDMPVGVQLMCGAFGEPMLYRIAAALEDSRGGEQDE